MKKKIPYKCSKCGQKTEKDRKISNPVCYDCKKERKSIVYKNKNK